MKDTRQGSTEALLRSLKELQVSTEYSDLKVFCGDRVFLAHKALVCTRSAFFAKACKWGNDAQTKGEVDLGDDDPKLVKLMMDYLYQLDYNDVLPAETPPPVEESSSKEPDSPVARTVKFFEDIGSAESSVPLTEEASGPRIPWDHGLTPLGKKRKQKQMKLDGTWDDRLTQEMIDESEPLAEILVEEPPPEEEPALEPSWEPEVKIEETDGWLVSREKVPRDRKLRLPDSTSPLDTDRIVVNAGLYALADKYEIDDLKDLAQVKFSKAVAANWKSEAFVRGAELAFSTTPSSDSGLRSVVLNTLHEHRELTDYEEVQNLLDSGNGIAWQLVKVLISVRGFGWP